MKDLKGKKLLILAGSVHECDLVRRAKELGVYTIVTDYYDVETSPAKQIADEYWDISWTDMEALEEKCRKEKIDGVTAGYSESTVESCIQLCNRLGLPCYCTKEQLDVLKDKARFKDECRQNGVPVVHEYKSVEDVNSFPIIVKPVDRGGSIGVGIATDNNSLKKVYDYAMEMSYCKKVIIEDYIDWGSKFDAYYAITDGEISFLSTSDTINAAGNGLERVVQSGWVLPSRYQDAYLEKVDKNVRKMIAHLQIKNGFFFFSGFSDGERFVFFETGFRLSGGHMYRYFKANGLPDIQDVFIQHALTGTCEGLDFRKEQNELKALIINFYAKEGTLSRVDGFTTVSHLPECGFSLPMCRIGTVCHQDKAILNKLGMVHLYSKEKTVLLDSMEKVYSSIIAEDQYGNDMIYDRMSREMVSSIIK